MKNDKERKSLIDAVINGYQQQYPSTRRFKLLREHEQIIDLYLAEDDFTRLAIMYGIPFVEKLMQLLLVQEDFEQCALIQRQLEELLQKIKLRSDYTTLEIMIHQI